MWKLNTDLKNPQHQYILQYHGEPLHINIIIVLEFYGITLLSEDWKGILVNDSWSTNIGGSGDGGSTDENSGPSDDNSRWCWAWGSGHGVVNDSNQWLEEYQVMVVRGTGNGCDEKCGGRSDGNSSSGDGGREGKWWLWWIG